MKRERNGRVRSIHATDSAILLRVSLELPNTKETVVNHKPPYSGQGKRLPAELGIDGYWVEEGRSFLFRPDPSRPLGELHGIIGPGGVEAEGFNVDVMA